jgi:hypothetical protein
MFSFSTIFGLISAAPEVIAEFEALLQSPAVQQLENLFGIHTTLVTTPGAAAVIEPVTPPVGTAGSKPTGIA